MALTNISICSTSIPDGINLVATSYQIALSPNFEDDELVEDIKKDTENLYGRTFDLDFNAYEVYYGRVKLHFDDDSYYGWTRPIMLTKDSDGCSCNNTIIATPKVWIEGDNDHCDLGGFKVHSSEFKVYDGHSTHRYTDWVIKTVDGSVIYQSLKNFDDLTSIRVPNGVLDPDKIYVIEVTYVSSDNNKSNVGKLIIKTIGEAPDAHLLDNSDEAMTSTYDKDTLKAYNDLLAEYANHLALNKSNS